MCFLSLTVEILKDTSSFSESMVTKPVPIWERWMETPKGRERAYWFAAWGMVLLNLFIALGLILFLIFWFKR